MIPKDLVELKIKEWENENYPAIDKFHKFVFIFLVLTLFNEILISILDFILDRGK